MEFKLFLEKEEAKDIEEMIKKLPVTHQKLLNNYKVSFQNGHTLKGDDQSVGMVHHDKITVASPFNYGRGFVFLHEVAHIIFEHLMTKKLKQEWSKIVPKNPLRKKQSDEENFCMAYAATYALHPPRTHYHDTWVDFIKNKVPN